MIEPRIVHELIEKLRAAPDSKRRRQIVKDAAEAMGLHETTLYRNVKKAGFDFGRKTRSDCGQPRVDVSDEALKIIGRMIYGSKRKTDKITMPVWVAVKVAKDNGLIGQDVSEDTVSRLLRERGLSRPQLGAPKATNRMASKYPNHVHQLDASVCVQWDLRGRGKMVDRDMRTEYYKNKPRFWKKIKKVLLRYLLTDHCSGVIYPYYYYARGEDTANLLDFVMRAWAEKDDELFTFHGVPEILMLDRGAANTSDIFNNFLKNLDVKAEDHVPGRPWINGQVECAQNIWETTFESQLSLKLAESLDELNMRAWDWAVYLNTQRPHSRLKTTRQKYWAWRVTADKLRLLPSRDVCQMLAYASPEQRTVTAERKIGYKKGTYQIHGGVRAGQKIKVIYNPYKYPEIIATTLDGRELVATHIPDGAHGFPENAPVIGESFKAQAYNDTERFRADAQAGKIAVAGIEPKLQRPLLQKAGVLSAEPRKTGAPIVDENPVITYSRYDARKQIREMLGRGLTAAESDFLDQIFGEIVTDTEVESAFRRLTTPAAISAV